MPPRRRSPATPSSTTASPSRRGSGRASRARYAKRRQRRLSRVDNDLTASQWADLLHAWAGCAYCRSPSPALQRDCVMPVSRGGRYTLENVVPACASCNASKHNSEVTGWLRRKKLDERTFLVRHATILRALRADE
ncbi:HNH endonuclease [Dietzia sp. SYD-A1]|uniref:HNH endonuclease n=1 Tax=Dietzia sp. SYD-A1 TaxID=2780141 RepID=UPI0018911271|nr:HNH endonuclease signature motif containing protein [Dietzia sp. SYD-A1]